MRTHNDTPQSPLTFLWTHTHTHTDEQIQQIYYKFLGFIYCVYFSSKHVRICVCVCVCNRHLCLCFIKKAGGGERGGQRERRRRNCANKQSLRASLFPFCLLILLPLNSVPICCPPTPTSSSSGSSPRLHLPLSSGLHLSPGFTFLPVFFLFVPLALSHHSQALSCKTFCVVAMATSLFASVAGDYGAVVKCDRISLLQEFHLSSSYETFG